MSKDVECPYCGEWEEINHDDGYGYEEDCRHEQECGHCEKNFVFNTEISFYYEAFKADCLNDKEHNFIVSNTVPRQYSKMECTTCDATRALTEEEMLHHLKKYADE